MAIKLHARPNDREGVDGRDKSERKIDDKQRGGRSENRRRMARWKALKFALKGIADAVESIGDMGVGTGPTQREAETIIEESGQRGSKKTDYGNAPPRAAFAPHTVEPEGNRQWQVVGWVIAPGAEKIGDLLRRFLLLIWPEMEFRQQALIVRPYQGSKCQSSGEYT